jgi:SAM-dependent methyltransferase
MRDRSMGGGLVALEPAVCPRCGISPSRVVRRARSWLDAVPGTYEVRECPSCALWMTSPRPPAEELWRVYPPGYHRVGRSDSRSPARAGESGTLLDVGCGVGDFLVLARAEGWRCTGIEISPAAAAVARARGFDVIVGDATEVTLPPTRFDRVRCAHTLEHVPDPVRLLQALGQAAAHDGTIEVIVPNRRSATATLFRSRWYHLDVPRHLFHFRPEDIGALAGQAGLTVKSLRHTASPSGLLGSVDCVLAAHIGRARTRLRSRSGLRRLALPLTWALARLGRADVVRYELSRAEQAPPTYASAPAPHEAPVERPARRADGGDGEV